MKLRDYGPSRECRWESELPLTYHSSLSLMSSCLTFVVVLIVFVVAVFLIVVIRDDCEKQKHHATFLRSGLNNDNNNHLHAAPVINDPVSTGGMTVRLVDNSRIPNDMLVSRQTRVVFSGAWKLEVTSGQPHLHKQSCLT